MAEINGTTMGKALLDCKLVAQSLESRSVRAAKMSRHLKQGAVCLAAFAIGLVANAVLCYFNAWRWGRMPHAWMFIAGYAVMSGCVSAILWRQSSAAGRAAKEDVTAAGVIAVLLNQLVNMRTQSMARATGQQFGKGVDLLGEIRANTGLRPYKKS